MIETAKYHLYEKMLLLKVILGSRIISVENKEAFTWIANKGETRYILSRTRHIQEFIPAVSAHEGSGSLGHACSCLWAQWVSCLSAETWPGKWGHWLPLFTVVSCPGLESPDARLSLCPLHTNNREGLFEKHKGVNHILIVVMYVVSSTGMRNSISLGLVYWLPKHTHL